MNRPFDPVLCAMAATNGRFPGRVAPGSDHSLQPRVFAATSVCSHRFVQPSVRSHKCVAAARFLGDKVMAFLKDGSSET